MPKAAKTPEFVTLSVRVAPSIVEKLDLLALQGESVSVLYPLTRSDVVRMAIDRHLRAERRKDDRARI